jgi:hypothetical protein
LDKRAEWDAVAKTRPAGLTKLGGGVFGRARNVVITVNTYNDGNATYWNDGIVDNNARTLLHELAHAYNFMSARSGGFAIGNSSELFNGEAFEELLKEKCIP